MSILYFRNSDGKFVQIPSIPGKSAYEIAVERGVFSGTEEEFAQHQVFENKDILDSITQEQIELWNNSKGMTDEEKQQMAGKIDSVEITDEDEIIFYSQGEEIDRIKIKGGMTDEEKQQLSMKFDDVVYNEEETTDMQTALDFYSNGVFMKTVYFKGSGGGIVTSAYISTTLSENVMVGTGEDFELLLDFSSPSMGRGTLKVFINDVDALTTSIGQGESTTVIPSNLFTKGTNRLVVYVLDRVGIMSNSLTFYVRYGSTELVSDFDPYSAYDYGSTIRYYFTPTALDTSLTLTFYMSVDGQVQDGIACTSDTRGYYTFPSTLGVGSHYCEAYVMDSNGTKSNILAFNLVILDTNSIVIASDTKSATVEEGEQLSLDYKVYMKNNSSFITKTYVDGNLVNTGTCGLDFNYYRTSSLTEGVHTVKLEVWDVMEIYSDYITWTVTITPSTYEMAQPVNAGALFIATAINKSNADERRSEFIGVDQAGEEIVGTLYNFAFNSESGWVDDELIISGNSHVEIPIQPLADNARYGFTLDLEFTSRQIGVEDAEVLTLWNDEKNCGIKITTENLILRSAEGNQCNLYYSDNERTNVMFVIDRNERKAKIYLNGVMCEAFHLSDYSIDGVPYLEDFTVNSNLVLGGYNKNGYSKIRNLRIYNIALTTDEIINNWVSCEIDKGKQRQLVEFQKGNDLPTLTIYCDFSGLGKDDKKPCKIVYNSTDEVKYGKSFTLDHRMSTCQYQGTSSMAYPIKNYRINLADAKGNKWKYEFPNSQPEHRFTLKADFMNSCHAHNTGMAKFINDNLYNYNLNDEKSMNPFKWQHVQSGGDINDFREAINGFPCRLILVNDGTTPLNEGQNEPTPGNTKDMGIFNFNNDKDATTTLGFNSDIFPNCASYEVTANSDTSAGAFMSFNGKILDYLIDSSWGRTNIYFDYIKAEDYSAPISKNGYITGNGYTLFDENLAEISGGSIENATYVRISCSLTSLDDEVLEAIANGDISIGKHDIHANLVFNHNTVYAIEWEYLTNKGLYTIESEELDYIKQSFELRYPDADDVSEDWGFMGVEAVNNIMDYYVVYGSFYSPTMPISYFNTNELTIKFNNDEVFAYKTTNGEWHYGNVSGTTINIPDNSEFFFYTQNKWEYVEINGVKYYGNLISNNNLTETKTPYKVNGIQVLTLDYYLDSNRKTSLMEVGRFNGAITVKQLGDTRYGIYIDYFDSNGKYLSNVYDFAGVTHTIPSGAAYASVSLYDTHNATEIIINDVSYRIGVQMTDGNIKEPYMQVIPQKEEGTGLKGLIDWVDNCTDEEFVRDFEQHFHKDYTLRYYALVVLIGAVDKKLFT